MFVSKCHSSKETIFTRQQKYVTCQINKDTNSYYTTPICIYLYIINNALNEAEDAELRNGLLLNKPVKSTDHEAGLSYATSTEA
jgi:hypothetical protein